MTDQQQSLAGYRGKVQEPGEFANPNEGKSLLNENDEYILQLTKFPHRISQKQPKEKRDGTKYFEDVEKAVCEFEERDTKNIVTAFFRIDKLNFADEDAYTSAVIRFFQKIGNPLPENVYPDWTQYFIVGMRFRSRVVVGMDKSPSGAKTPNGRYYLDVPTCRKLLPSDTAGESFAKDAQPKTSTVSLSNALLLAKGAPNRQEAIMKILEASGSTEFMQAFIVADKSGQIKYPI